MNLPKPLNNNVLVEIIDPHSAVSRSTENESQKKGKLIAASVALYHLTASAAVQFTDGFQAAIRNELEDHIRKGSYVYWEEYANEGQTFTHDGKQYAFVAWWRLTGFEEPEEKK